MTNKDNFNINYLKYENGISLKKQYNKLIVDVTCCNIILGRRYSVQIGDLLDQL